LRIHSTAHFGIRSVSELQFRNLLPVYFGASTSPDEARAAEGYGGVVVGVVSLAGGLADGFGVVDAEEDGGEAFAAAVSIGHESAEAAFDGDGPCAVFGSGLGAEHLRPTAGEGLRVGGLY